MPRIGSVTVRLAGLIAACAFATAACSGTVEASYRPPAPPAPSPSPTPDPTPTPAPTVTPALACGPDQVRVQLGNLQSNATSRALPLLLRGTGPVPCGVANPVGVELLDAEGKQLTTRIETADLPPGRTPADNFTADNGVMVWLQWRVSPSSRTVDPATDCVSGQSLRLTLVKSATPIPVNTAIAACDGGTVYVSPAEPDLG